MSRIRDAEPRVERRPPPFAAFFLIALAIAYLAWYVVTQGVLTEPTIGDLVVHLLRVTPGIAAILLPAALLLRHPDAPRRLPILLLGTLLFAAVQSLIVLADPLQPLFEALTPAAEDVPSLVPLAAVYEIVVGVLSAAGLGCIAFGLAAARRFEDRPGRGATAAASIVPIVAVLATIAGVLGTTRLDLGDVPMTPGLAAYLVASVGLGIVRVVAWAFLASVAIRGWRAGEAPLAGWWLAVLAAGLVLLALAMLSVRGLIDVTDPAVDEVYGYVEATAYAAGIVCLLVAVAIGLPALDLWDDDAPGANSPG
jgi:hypothetical protein